MYFVGLGFYRVVAGVDVGTGVGGRVVWRRMVLAIGCALSLYFLGGVVGLIEAWLGGPSEASDEGYDGRGLWMATMGCCRSIDGLRFVGWHRT